LSGKRTRCRRASLAGADTMKKSRKRRRGCICIKKGRRGIILLSETHYKAVSAWIPINATYEDAVRDQTRARRGWELKAEEEELYLRIETFERAQTNGHHTCDQIFLSRPNFLTSKPVRALRRRRRRRRRGFICI